MKKLLLTVFVLALLLNGLYAGEKAKQEIYSDLDKRVELIRRLASMKMELQQTRGKIVELEKSLRDKETEITELKTYLSDKFIPELDKILGDLGNGTPVPSGSDAKPSETKADGTKEKEDSIFPEKSGNSPDSGSDKEKTVAAKDSGFSWWPF